MSRGKGRGSEPGTETSPECWSGHVRREGLLETRLQKSTAVGGRLKRFLACCNHQDLAY